MSTNRWDTLYNYLLDKILQQIVYIWRSLKIMLCAPSARFLHETPRKLPGSPQDASTKHSGSPQEAHKKPQKSPQEASMETSCKTLINGPHVTLRTVKFPTHPRFYHWIWYAGKQFPHFDLKQLTKKCVSLPWYEIGRCADMLGQNFGHSFRI